MNKTMKKINILLSLLLVFVLCINMTAYAEDDSESIDTEQSSFTEIDGEAIDFVEYVDGIYNVSKNEKIITYNEMNGKKLKFKQIRKKQKRNIMK